MQAARFSKRLREAYDALMADGTRLLVEAAERAPGDGERHAAYVSALVALARAEQVAQTGSQSAPSSELRQWLDRHYQARRKQQMASGALLAWFIEKPVVTVDWAATDALRDVNLEVKS